MSDFSVAGHHNPFGARAELTGTDMVPRQYRLKQAHVL